MWVFLFSWSHAIVKTVFKGALVIPEKVNSHIYICRPKNWKKKILFWITIGYIDLLMVNK